LDCIIQKHFNANHVRVVLKKHNSIETIMYPAFSGLQYLQYLFLFNDDERQAGAWMYSSSRHVERTN